MTERSEPIRVLHVITRLIVGGAQENTVFTAASLQREPFHMEIASGPQTGPEGSLWEEARLGGVPVTVVPELVRELSPLKDAVALWKLYRLMRSGRYQIVHTHSSKAGILGRLAAWLARVPVIVHTVHGWGFHDHLSRTRRLLYVVLERFAAPRADALIAVSERDVEKGLQERIGRRDQYRLIRSAIPLEVFEPRDIDRASVRKGLGLPEEVAVLGSVGRLSPQKNPLDWVRVAERVSRDLPDCRFLVVGDGPLRPSVENMVRHSGLRERTVLTGLRRDVPCLLAAMDVFLLTSLWEGLPRTVVQAMAMGLPVVATGIDGSAEAISSGETGYLCTPGAIEELAERCIELLTQPETRRAMGAEARAFARREFDLRRMGEQIESLYLELV